MRLSHEDAERLVKQGRLPESVLKIPKQPNKKGTKAAKKASINNRKSKDKSDVSETLLYNLLYPFYGDYFKKGELVRELQGLKERDFRIDVAIPRYKVGIEIDGITGHAMLPDGSLNKEGFRRDRTKTMLYVADGWIIIPCMKKHVTHEPDLILNAVEAAVKSRKRMNIEVAYNGYVYPRIIFDGG